MNLSTLITLHDGSKVSPLAFNPCVHVPESPEHLQQILQTSMDSIRQNAKLRLYSRAHATPALIEFVEATMALEAIVDAENPTPAHEDIQAAMSAMARRQKAEDEVFRTLHGAGFSH